VSRRVLYDTNVLLDVILLRAPHVAASAAAVDLVGAGIVEGFLAGHAVTTIAYLIQRERDRATAKNALAQLLSRIRVAPTTDSAVRLALAMDLSDFEDAVTVASAQEAGCELIVTRNIQHFRSAPLKAVLPETLVVSETTPD
jgi:predicted nucleic acid-binding protein